MLLNSVSFENLYILKKKYEQTRISEKQDVIKHYKIINEINVNFVADKVLQNVNNIQKIYKQHF